MRKRFGKLKLGSERTKKKKCLIAFDGNGSFRGSAVAELLGWGDHLRLLLAGGSLNHVCVSDCGLWMNYKEQRANRRTGESFF